MTVPIAVLRPEPGNAATAAAIEALGRCAIRLPLFVVLPLAWDGPDPDAHDALVLTSANAVRHAGPALSRYAALPVHAVGAATAAAAGAAGLHVVATGGSDGRALLDAALADGVRAALLLTARDRAVTAHPAVTAIEAVYASEAVDPVDPAPLTGSVALIHSPRAARRLAEIVPDRSRIAVATISAAAVAGLGSGWRAVTVAARPDDASVIAVAIALADTLARD
ncbi:uroporphyrinogen-III synthase [Sphingomonas sp. Leaf22]|uniref:uroporphyrinogen-III synthase n=1 Tax=Sphingomonas sp. Leaf22 TaxID=1735687 RepID=UPI0006FC2684|nr:uroporphyrinogen-III synthase [Sphingomonas sp. Leaf22]KQM91447.1 uroporphyrinogen-III synthase [Sphingomonas sp. Leaf22]